MSKQRCSDVVEARRQLPSLLESAHAGQAVIITRRGKPYAALVPIESLLVARPCPSIVALRGSGRGLWGKDGAAGVNRMRNEW
jgi:prevent-host-death family protein